MEVGFKIRSVNVKILLVLTYTEKFNVSFEKEMKNQWNAKMQSLSDTGLPYYLTSHCGTFKHVGGHKLLKACPFFVSWQIKKSKLPKDYLHWKGSLGGCGQFFPPPPPPQNCPLSTKINFWHCSGWKKIVHKWNLMHYKISVDLTYFAGL